MPRQAAGYPGSLVSFLICPSCRQPEQERPSLKSDPSRCQIKRGLCRQKDRLCHDPKGKLRLSELRASTCNVEIVLQPLSYGGCEG